MTKHYEYLYSGREGSYWLYCTILKNKPKLTVRYYHPWFKEYLEQETTKDRVREQKEKKK